MFKMVFVVNASLKMSTGKIASQTAHSAVSLYIKAKSSGKKSMFVFDQVDMWVRTGQTKVVVKGKDEQHLLDLERRAVNADLLTTLIRDSGRTQIVPGSLTCLAVFGEIGRVDTITGDLALYP